MQNSTASPRPLGLARGRMLAYPEYKIFAWELDRLLARAPSMEVPTKWGPFLRSVAGVRPPSFEVPSKIGSLNYTGPAPDPRRDMRGHPLTGFSVSLR